MAFCKREIKKKKEPFDYKIVCFYWNRFKHKNEELLQNNNFCDFIT
jgi:hypothetical protein